MNDRSRERLFNYRCVSNVPMAGAIFLLLTVLTIVGLTWAEGRAGAPRRDWLRNLQAWALQIGAAFVFLPFFQTWHGPTLFDARTMPFWLAFPLFVVVRDAVEWFFHLCQHRIPVLWRMHSLHHSDPEMSALTTNRHFWGDQVVKVMTVWPLAEVVLTPTPAIIIGYSFVGLYQYFVHANLKVNFGRWSWVLNSPAYHRLHHAREPEHHVCNLATLFPLWDVLARTYRKPVGWPATGLANAPDGFRTLLNWPLAVDRKDLPIVPAERAPST